MEDLDIHLLAGESQTRTLMAGNAELRYKLQTTVKNKQQGKILICFSKT